MLTAIRGDTNNGWVAVDDFQFIPEVSDCSIVPPEADPHPSSTTDGGDTTMYPPSKSQLSLMLIKLNVNMCFYENQLFRHLM